MPVSKLVGARVKRREDPRLIRGLASSWTMSIYRIRSTSPF